MMYIFCGAFLYYQVFPMKKTCMVIKMTTFLVYFIVAPPLTYNNNNNIVAWTGMAANKTYSFFGKRSYRF